MSTSSKIFALAGCLFLASAGALSAYGFHGLEGKITAAKQESWHWAVQMQFYHGLGLVLLAALGRQIGVTWPYRIAGTLMIAGILIFSFLIYAEILGAPESLGEIVPMGGSCMMLSWLFLGIAVLRSRA